MDRLYRIEYQGAAQYAVERDGALRRVSGDIFDGRTAGDAMGGGLNATGLGVLAPMKPAKVVCAGLNYKEQAAEPGRAIPAEPLIFIKPSTAVIGPDDPIRIPPGVGRVDHEAELGVVIGRRAHRVPRAKAWEHILGLICVNDVTARDLQKKESHNTRAKGFDTFAPIGPCIALGFTGEGRSVEGWVNNERRQGAGTRSRGFPIEQHGGVVAFAMAPEPSDRIAPRAPEGMGPVPAGATVTVQA